jgi:hypothetical protein
MAETPESQRQRLRLKLGRHQLVVVSNGEPYGHIYRHGEVEWVPSGAGRRAAQNPYAPDPMADRIPAAVEMDPVEVRRRAYRMRERVCENNIHKWATSILKKISKIA